MLILFPDWNEGFNKILESMNLSNLQNIKEEGTEKVSNAININKIKERISYSRKY